jgi:hypothetical protein
MAVFWTLIGLPVAVRIMARPLGWFCAPALGWALHSAFALPVYSAIGMSRPIVAATTTVCALLGVAALWRMPRRAAPVDAWFFLTLAGAALLGLAPLAAILPKETADGVVLAGPVFDHTKIALIDEMIRSGVSATNPFFREAGTPDRVAYYYLWHFGAAVFGVLTGASGWEADAALTWFTAFASVLMAAGLAVWIGGRGIAGVIAIAVAATTSARPVFHWLFGSETFAFWIWDSSGFGAWLFQVSWAPQHVASAMSLVLAVFLLAQLSTPQKWSVSIIVGLLAAAAFQSSAWVGGVTFGIAAAAIGAWLLWTADGQGRRWLLLHAVVGGAVALILVAPFLRDQLAMAAARGTGTPLDISPLEIWADAIPDWLGRVLDLPAYWLVYLPLELPASYPAGIVMVFVLWRRRRTGEDRKAFETVALLVAGSLMVAWLLISTVGDNNDLGWRAVLPAVLILIGLAAAGIAHWMTTPHRVALTLACCGVLLGLPGGLLQMRGNASAEPRASARVFAGAPVLWEAVRRHTSAQERIANNPLSVADITPWPANASWALLANRRSCYAGQELALPFAPLSAERRAETEALFVRVFAGDARPDDIDRMVDVYLCDVAVVTPQDGAWPRDPFAANPRYRLADEKPNTWRIYRKAP